MCIINKFVKKIFWLFILVLCISCKENKNKFLLSKKGIFEHIDFSSLSVNSDSEIELIDYSYIYENINLGNSEFSIVLIDFDQNNKYNDSVDLILINPPIHSNIELNNLNFTNFIEANKLFSIDDIIFSIKSITHTQNFYEIEINKENLTLDDVSIQNRMVSKIDENIFYEDINNKKINLLTGNKKFIYIEFWSTSCSACLELIPQIRNLNNQYSDIIDIHSIAVLNNYNTKEQVFEFIKKNRNFSWNIGFSNENLESKLRFGRLPIGYFFDNKGNLLT